MGYFLSSSAQLFNKMLLGWLFSLAELKQLRNKYEARINYYAIGDEVCIEYRMFSQGVYTNKEYSFYIPKADYNTITPEDTIDNFTIKLRYYSYCYDFNIARKPLGEHFLETL